MTFYQDLHTTLYNQDFRANELPAESVQMVVTSPPYWGLRKYSGEQDLVWGSGDCEHQWGEEIVRKDRGSLHGANAQAGNTLSGVSGTETRQGNFCSLCGAWKGAYGLEPTPEMYVQHTIEILREIRRVLRKGGVVFWNIGDSYVSTAPGTMGDKLRQTGILSGVRTETAEARRKYRPVTPPNLKPKDLCLIPFRVAIAAQEDGWWVRSIIIWSKPNPMPESVQDRPTESHEYILMLTKNSRYYWDADAVREPSETLNPNSVSYRERGKSDSRIKDKLGGKPAFGDEGFWQPNPAGRNIRTVWEFPTQPYPEAHFAVFPEKLPEICIKAATPEVGCCSKCGAPWERVVERVDKGWDGSRYGEKAVAASGGVKSGGTAQSTLGSSHGQLVGSQKTLGWQPTCKCNADKVPSVVLDPFCGAGTSLWVAKKLNRRAIGYELSEEYCQLAAERLRQQVML